MRHNDRLSDVGLALVEAMAKMTESVRKFNNRPENCPKTSHYLFGLWTRAAERNRDNQVFYREALAKAEKFAS